jgi:hypothetical protein
MQVYVGISGRQDSRCRPVDRPVDRQAQKAPDQRIETALHWVRVGSSICDQTVFFEIVADRPAHRPAHPADHF